MMAPATELTVDHLVSYLNTTDPLLQGHPFYNEKVVLSERMASLKRNTLVVTYYLSPSQIWLDKRGDLWWDWHDKRGVVFDESGLIKRRGVSTFITIYIDIY